MKTITFWTLCCIAIGIHMVTNALLSAVGALHEISKMAVNKANEMNKP